jgi:ribosomal protein S18 acetylase RimI-like enzyme
LDNPGAVIDLKGEDSLIEQYVELRNLYCELLLTHPVTIEGTKEWLERDEVEVMGIVREGVLLGVAILYLHRAGEIAFFTRTPHQGVGSRLLKIMEGVARERKIESIWAWVREENTSAQRTFLKEKYVLRKHEERYFRQETKKGIIFGKKIQAE